VEVTEIPTPCRLVVCLACCVMLAPAQRNRASQAEEDLYQAAQVEADPTHRLYLVEQWRSAYPQSEFKDEQLRIKLVASRMLGRHEDVFAAAVDLVNLNPGDANALNSIVVTGPKLLSPTVEQIELVSAAARAVLTPPPTPAITLLNGVPTPKKSISAQSNPPSPVPPTTLESSRPESQAVTSMISEWRRNYRPAPDPNVQRKKDAETALEWVRNIRR
jgi:hypothetical protein